MSKELWVVGLLGAALYLSNRKPPRVYGPYEVIFVHDTRSHRGLERHSDGSISLNGRKFIRVPAKQYEDDIPEGYSAYAPADGGSLAEYGVSGKAKYGAFDPSKIAEGRKLHDGVGGQAPRNTGFTGIGQAVEEIVRRKPPLKAAPAPPGYTLDTFGVDYRLSMPDRFKATEQSERSLSFYDDLITTFERTKPTEGLSRFFPIPSGSRVKDDDSLRDFERSKQREGFRNSFPTRLRRL